MKIEKISDNQIKCTLTRADLETHQVKLTELAYGTDKARRLFQEMMEQAQIQCGFQADNTPLMIEAIPVNMDSIILMITKVEDPEELDTRFSRFAPFKHGSSTPVLELSGADDILDILRKLRDSIQSKNKSAAGTASTDKKQEKSAPGTEEPESEIDLIRLYRFRSLDHIISAARSLNDFYQGENALYKDPVSGDYQLVLHKSDCTARQFNKVCNILSEYGRGFSFDASGEAYLQEHGELITEKAIQVLAQLQAS